MKVSIKNYQSLIGEDLNEWFSVYNAIEYDDQYVFEVSSPYVENGIIIYKLERHPISGFYTLTMMQEKVSSPFLNKIDTLGSVMLNHANIANKHMILRNMLSLARATYGAVAKKERQ
jgi:hypothetical protein